MLFFGFFCTILNAKDEKGSSLHALIWSQTIICPIITKKEKEYQLSLLLWESLKKTIGPVIKEEGDLYLLLIIGAYLEYHRNKRVSIMTLLLVSLIVYKRRNIFTSIKGERNLIDLSFLFGHALASSLKNKNLLCTSPYSYTKLSINWGIWIQDFDISPHLLEKSKENKQKSQVKYNGHVSLIKLKWSCIQNSQSTSFKIFIVCVCLV